MTSSSISPTFVQNFFTSALKTRYIVLGYDREGDGMTRAGAIPVSTRTTKLFLQLQEMFVIVHQFHIPSRLLQAVNMSLIRCIVSFAWREVEFFLPHSVSEVPPSYYRVFSSSPDATSFPLCSLITACSCP